MKLKKKKIPTLFLNSKVGTIIPPYVIGGGDVEVRVENAGITASGNDVFEIQASHNMEIVRKVKVQLTSNNTNEVIITANNKSYLSPI